MAEVMTFGCRLNTVEGAEIARLAAGAEDTVVVNTCAVTAAAEREARHAIARVRRERPGTRIVVTGCAAQIDPTRWAALPGVARVLGNREKLLAEHWREGAGSAVGDIAGARGHQPAATAGIEGRARAFLDVQQGCDHACTFCIIPQGRGRNRSVPLESVVAQVRRLSEAGYAEVVLTGVDVASWGMDLPGRPGLGGLVRGILAGAPELERLRFSSLDPAALDEAFWDVFAGEERVMPHLHLSMQAASDMVLKRMRRRHSREGALAVVERARQARAGAGIGADLIAGFPTETEAQFEETLAFVEEARAPYLHVFPYSARPGTPAARMPQMPMGVRRERASLLRAAGARHAAAFHAAMRGQERVVVAERGGRGHTPEFAPVRLRLAAEPGMVVRGRVLAADAAGVEVG